MALTIRVNERTAERWRSVARYLGFPSAAAWLNALAEEKLKEIGDELPEEVLVWKKGILRVELRDPSADRRGMQAIPGILAPPFGIYRGTPWSYGGTSDNCFTLALLSSAVPYLALKRLRDCKALARQLNRLKVAWHEADPAKITGPGAAEAAEIVNRFRRDFGA